MARISIQLPPGLGRIPARAVALEAIERLAAKVRAEAEWNQILSNDAALEKWIAGRPFVRAITYPSIGPRQRISGPPQPIDQRAAPVVMRGAKFVRRYKYELQSDYVNELVERYLRRIKFSAHHWETEKHAAIRRVVCAYIRRQGFSLHPGYQPPITEHFRFAYVDGERVELSEQQIKASERARKRARDAAVRTRRRNEQRLLMAEQEVKAMSRSLSDLGRIINGPRHHRTGVTS